MAKYMISIFESEAGYIAGGEAVMLEVMADHNRFSEGVAGLGAQLLGGEALQGLETATTIRAGVVTDGPFVETKEAFGGYYVIEAPDLDTAIAVAKTCPARFVGVELRPVMTFE